LKAHKLNMGSGPQPTDIFGGGGQNDVTYCCSKEIHSARLPPSGCGPEWGPTQIANIQNGVPAVLNTFTHPAH